MSSNLELYEAIPSSAMVIVAHPDDAEFMCAGTIARWTRKGCDVSYVLVTSGDKGSSDPSVEGAALAAARSQEQQEAARIIGVNRVIFLRYQDGMVEPTLTLRKDLSRVIREWRPEAVICQDPTQFFSGRGYLNHPDHRAVGEAALSAIYPAARDRMTFPELEAAGFHPHKVLEVFIGAAAQPDLIVDISDTLQAKIAALLAHASQIGDWQPQEMIGNWARENAKDQPFDYGEVYRYLKLN